jgi:acetyltransferase-like isoleucine patch superfamily enzyme
MASLASAVQNRLLLYRLRGTPGVAIGADAQVNPRGITLKPNCTFTVGSRSIIEATIDFERDGAAVIVGENSYVGASIFKVADRVEIGSDVEIAWNCSVVDHDWESLAFERRRVDMRRWYTAANNWTHVERRPVRIGNRALIGFNAVILKGVQVGEGAVVGVNSVVTHDVAPYTVVAGVPAREVRKVPS